MSTVRKPIASSWITSAEYDDETRVLEITTAAGKSYTHNGVPPEVFDDFVNASSPGQFWHSVLKDGYP